MSKVAAAITSPATKATKQENSTMSRRSIRIRASPFHLFCAGRLASAKVRPLQSPDSRMMKIGKASQSRPAPRAALLISPVAVPLQRRGRGFEECAWDSAHCAETLAISAASNNQCEQFNNADSYHQRCECYRIVIEPMPPLYIHDTLPRSSVHMCRT
jgi:hypothetical protein